MNDILQPISDRLVTYFNDDMGMDVTESDIRTSKNDRIEILPHTVLINISGNINGGFILSGDDEIAFALLNLLSDVELSKEEQIELIGEALAESLNIIVGNAYHLIPGIGTKVTISPPFGLENIFNIKNFKNAETISKHFTSQSGKLSLIYINYNE